MKSIINLTLFCKEKSISVILSGKSMLFFLLTPHTTLYIYINNGYIFNYKCKINISLVQILIIISDTILNNLQINLSQILLKEISFKNSLNIVTSNYKKK